MSARRILQGVASVLMAGAACVGMATASPAESNGEDLAGTYQVMICRGPCSFASVGNAVIEGSVVLLANEMQPSEASKLDPSFKPFLSGGNANGCYVLRRLSNIGYVGYANTRGSALTVWSQTTGDLHLSLFRSPDAGYEVVLRGDARALSGTGQSWGAGVAAPSDKTMDHVIARRIGTAEIRACGFRAERS